MKYIRSKDKLKNRDRSPSLHGSEYESVHGTRYHKNKTLGKGSFAEADEHVESNGGKKAIAVLKPVAGTYCNLEVYLEARRKYNFYRKVYPEYNSKFITFHPTSPSHRHPIEDYRLITARFNGLLYEKLNWDLKNTTLQVELFLSAVRALKKCHRAGLVVVDLKRDNIIYDPEGNKSYLIDGGQSAKQGRPICLHFYSEGEIEKDQQTYKQYAPECFSLTPAKARFSMDIYSLGVMMAKMISERHRLGEIKHLLDLCQSNDPKARPTLRRLENELLKAQKKLDPEKRNVCFEESKSERSFESKASSLLVEDSLSSSFEESQDYSDSFAESETLSAFEASESLNVSDETSQGHASFGEESTLAHQNTSNKAVIKQKPLGDDLASDSYSLHEPELEAQVQELSFDGDPHDKDPQLPLENSEECCASGLNYQAELRLGSNHLASLPMDLDIQTDLKEHSFRPKDLPMKSRAKLNAQHGRPVLDFHYHAGGFSEEELSALPIETFDLPWENVGYSDPKVSSQTFELSVNDNLLHANEELLSSKFVCDLNQIGSLAKEQEEPWNDFRGLNGICYDIESRFAEKPASHYNCLTFKHHNENKSQEKLTDPLLSNLSLFEGGANNRSRLLSRPQEKRPPFFTLESPESPKSIHSKQDFGLGIFSSKKLKKPDLAEELNLNLFSGYS